MQKHTWKLGAAIGLLAAFASWTLGVMTLDVQPIGPQGSAVGFSAMNGFIHRLTGVHMTLYVITDWLGLVPVGVGLGFAMLGLIQWVKRKSLLKVDGSILALGGFYLLVVGAYLFFETCPVNYRPVLIEGCLEVSYPSSTTLLVMCVMPAAAMQLSDRIQNAVMRSIAIGSIVIFTALMIAGRLLSGVHWFSDIVGGVLLSGALLTLYAAACDAIAKNNA